MPATPRTHPPAALRLVDASPTRGRLHRALSSSAADAGVLGDSGADPSGRFALTARALAAAAREMGLKVPSFQSPPRSDQLDRSLQRSRNGDCVVAVRVRGRPFAVVVADVIEGIVVCNRLDASAAGVVRDGLWREVEGSHDASAPAVGTVGPCTVASESRQRKPDTFEELYGLDEAA